ncbi:hypothetical protein GR925_23310 [Streptomyces sp. HUCO-GS316]|uniref:hypothetical protein n=1 Tax=Streptomyces sp. HUCO-GS316 TaxID=2692198 RepID=UPI001369F52D|nr:hypothetical protein [Streptomyces sp. HUCO-GS316]MXM66276.1 hypothetical protein [Streptomyces sp. HUCO-GS316]
MPRGRHRHSPPLHRLLPPSAIAGVSFVCAFGPWAFSEPAVLRVVAAVAAATAVVGAAVMRRWDAQAGKQVADLTRARASDEWRHEERVAELETDLEESRELRAKLEQRLRAKRGELAGLRNEHAALLRRYATAETERASALEGRRLLEIEAAVPAPALPPAPVTEPGEEAGAVAAPAEAEENEAAPEVFSPEGSRLFLRAKEALGRFDGDGDGDDDPSAEDGASAQGDDSAQADDGSGVEEEADPKAGTKADDASEASEADNAGPSDGKASDKADVTPGGTSRAQVDGKAEGKIDIPSPAKGEPVMAAAEPGTAAGGTAAEAAQEDESRGKPEAADGHERAAATNPAGPAAQPAQQPSGHFVSPTAVAVVPAAPVRRAAVEGGFDFFGTKQASPHEALEAVQNEDLADVVGQEALALHKAESEAEFKPAGEESRGVGQVIDLTAHDETEQIDVQGLRSAVS